MAAVDRTLRAVRQSGRLEVHPPIAQAGRDPRPARKAKTALTATFKPARKGRPVTLQYKDGRRWVADATAREDRGGRAEFAARSTRGGDPVTYRVVASRSGRLARVKTDSASTDEWGAPDFSDQFSGRRLAGDWSHRLYGYSKESQRKCSKAAEEAVKVRKGVARLSVLKDPRRNGTCKYAGKRYSWRLNGHIGTEGTQTLRYGYAAARIKFQPRRGQHASFWMQPDSPLADEGSAARTGSEIDVIEWFGDKAPYGGLTSFIYYYPDNHRAGVTAKKVGGYIKDPEQYGGDWASKYHVFSVEWTPKRYVFRIDGQETFRTKQGASGRPQYLILSLLSSDYELKYLGRDKRLPQTMSVDWVRFWQR